MPFTNTLMLLVRWLRPARAATHREPDPADLGTAFGMECWLEEHGTEPERPADRSSLVGTPHRVG